MSFVRKDRQRAQNEWREDYKPPVARAPNPEILEHERKRAIELKILQFREAMEERNYSEEEIEKKVAEIRKQLTAAAAPAGAAAQGKLSSHEVAKRQEQKNAAFAGALGVSQDQRPGDAFNEEIIEQKREERKAQQQKEWEARQEERERRNQEYEERKKQRERDAEDRRRPVNEENLDDDLDRYMAKKKKGRDSRSRSRSPARKKTRRSRSRSSSRSRSRSRSRSSNSGSSSSSDSD